MRYVGWFALFLFLSINLLAYRHAGSFFFYTDGGLRTPPPEEISRAQKIVMLFRGVRIPKPMAHTSPDSFGAPYEEVSVPGRDYMPLSAWRLLQPNADSVVLLFHGYSSEKSGLIPEARMFFEMGYEVVMVDFPGSGGSPGNVTSLGIHESEDVARVIEWARELWPQRRLVVYGHSMGGVAILRAMAVSGVQPDVAVVESIFDTLLQAIRFRFELLSVPSFPAAELLLFWGSVQLGANGFDHNTVRYAQSVRTPTMIIHGEDDRRAMVDGAERVYEALAGPRQLLLIKNAGHVNPCLADPEKWKTAVHTFIEPAQER